MTLDLVFGCAPMGGRVEAATGQDAVRIALDHGITRFDVARSYGFGSGERLLGQVLAQRRSQVQIYTKAGILPRATPYSGSLFALARRIYSFAPALRPLVRRASGSRLQPGYLSSHDIAASFETSLRELGTDYVDVLFLHDAPTTITSDQAVMDLLSEIRDSGRAREIGSAGPLETGLSMRKVFAGCAIQTSVAELMRHESLLPGFILGNRPFGVLAGGTDGGRTALPRSMVLRAPQALGRCSAVVTSMFSPQHILKNVRAFVEGPAPDDVALRDYIGLAGAAAVGRASS